MRRLIDADVALQRFIEETEASGKNVIHINTIKRILQDIDTAYDVEKVVAELEKRSNDVISNIFAYEDDDHTGIYNDGLSDGYEYAIDIVKRGGAK